MFTSWKNSSSELEKNISFFAPDDLIKNVLHIIRKYWKLYFMFFWWAFSSSFLQNKINGFAICSQFHIEVEENTPNIMEATYNQLYKHCKWKLNLLTS